MILLLGVLLAGCPTQAPPTPSPTVAEAAVRESIDETTVGDLDGTRVAVGTMLLSGSYTLADGSERQGVTAVLALPDDSSIWVGLGSVVEVEGTTWEVVEIEKTAGELGSVTLEQR